MNERGFNTTLITHELVHVAYAERLGNLRILLGRDPHWFNEGLAVIIGQDLDETLFVPNDIEVALDLERHWTDWGDHVSTFGWKHLCWCGATGACIRCNLGGQRIARFGEGDVEGIEFRQSIARVSKL